MASNTDKNIKPAFICPYCGDTFTRESIWKKHVASCEDKGEVDEKGNKPEPFSDPSISEKLDLKTKDPDKMTEIEKMEHDLTKKKAELKAKETEELAKKDKVEKELRSKGYFMEPVLAGNFKHIIIRNQNNLAGVFDEQDKAGYDYILHFTTPNGLLYILFKARKI